MRISCRLDERRSELRLLVEDAPGRLGDAVRALGFAEDAGGGFVRALPAGPGADAISLRFEAWAEQMVLQAAGVAPVPWRRRSRGCSHDSAGGSSTGG